MSAWVQFRCDFCGLYAGGDSLDGLPRGWVRPDVSAKGEAEHSLNAGYTPGNTWAKPIEHMCQACFFELDAAMRAFRNARRAQEGKRP